MKKSFFLLFTLLFIAIAAPAGAYVVDFTGSEWNQGSNTTWSYNYSAIGTVTLNSNSPNNLTWNGDGPETNSSPVSLYNYSGNGDGIGINTGGDNDEVNDGQTLTVTFASPVFVSSISFLDFFSNANGDQEQAQWSTDNANWTTVSADTNQKLGSSWGEYMFNPGITGAVTNLYFKGVASSFEDGDSDFSLAKVEVSSVPIPGAVWLLGSGLGALVVGRRRKRA